LAASSAGFGAFSMAASSLNFMHDFDQSFTSTLFKEKRSPCDLGNAKVLATLDARAMANFKVPTSSSLTIIATLRPPLDLSQSYLYFKNKGKVSKIFTLNAKGKAVFKIGDFKIASLENLPGVPCIIPKLFTVGPNFKLLVAAEAEA
jgi:chitinase